MQETKELQLVYLDNAATSYPKPESVYEAVSEFIRTNAGSPSRGLGEGSTDTNRLLASTRRRIAKFLGIAEEHRLIFTYSATDGLSTILFGFLRSGDHVLISPLEHNSVLRPLDRLGSDAGVTFSVLPHDGFGRVEPDAIKSAVKPNTKLICLSMVSNVTGEIQPYMEVCAKAAEIGVPVLLDGAQAAGHLPIELDKWGAAFFACPGHKSMLGIQGTGLMFIREGYDVRALRVGGTGFLSESIKHPTALPQYYESGTINMPGVASLAAGLDHIESEGLAEIMSRIERLTSLLLTGLTDIPGITVYGRQEVSGGHGGVVSFNVGTLDCAEVGEVLAGRYRIANRIGIHCAPMAHEMFGTLGRGGTVRFSIGAFNNESQIRRAIIAVREIAEKMLV